MLKPDEIITIRSTLAEKGFPSNPNDPPTVWTESLQLALDGYLLKNYQQSSAGGFRVRIQPSNRQGVPSELLEKKGDPPKSELVAQSVVSEYEPVVNNSIQESLVKEPVVTSTEKPRKAKKVSGGTPKRRFRIDSDAEQLIIDD